MVSSVLDFDKLASQTGDAIEGAIEWVGMHTVEFLFAVSPLRTEGVWPFGRPVAPSSVGADAGFNGGAVAYFARQAYEWSSVEVAGTMLLFSLLFFVVLFTFGGYAQFFDWELPPQDQQRDPVYGMLLMLFWFPVYFALLTVVHELYFLIAPPPGEFFPILLTLIPSAAFLPGGQLAAGLGILGTVAYAVLMYVRAILVAAYLVFGPVFVAIAWADLYTVSDQALSLLKYSVGVAIAPLGMPVVLWVMSLLLGGEVPGLDLIPILSNSAIQAINVGATTFLGVFVYAGLVWAGIFLSWKVFRKSGGWIDKAGGTVGRIGSAAGIYQYSGRRDAVRAMKYGPGAVAGKKAFEGVDGNRGDSSGDSGTGSDTDSGGEGGFGDSAKEWMKNYWDRDGGR